jgi:hypothetical protein
MPSAAVCWSGSSGKQKSKGGSATAAKVCLRRLIGTSPTPAAVYAPSLQQPAAASLKRGCTICSGQLLRAHHSSVVLSRWAGCLGHSASFSSLQGGGRHNNPPQRPAAGVRTRRAVAAEAASQGAEDAASAQPLKRLRRCNNDKQQVRRGWLKSRRSCYWRPALHAAAPLSGLHLHAAGCCPHCNGRRLATCSSGPHHIKRTAAAMACCMYMQGDAELAASSAAAKTDSSLADFP